MGEQGPQRCLHGQWQLRVGWSVQQKLPAAVPRHPGHRRWSKLGLGTLAITLLLLLVALLQRLRIAAGFGLPSCRPRAPADLGRSPD